MVKRLFVEKRPGFDIEAGHLRADLIDSLQPDPNMELRPLNRNDVEGISDE